MSNIKTPQFSCLSAACPSSCTPTISCDPKPIPSNLVSISAASWKRTIKIKCNQSPHPHWSTQSPRSGSRCCWGQLSLCHKDTAQGNQKPLLAGFSNIKIQPIRAQPRPISTNESGAACPHPADHLVQDVNPGHHSVLHSATSCSALERSTRSQILLLLLTPALLCHKVTVNGPYYGHFFTFAVS